LSWFTEHWGRSALRLEFGPAWIGRGGVSSGFLALAGLAWSGVIFGTILTITWKNVTRRKVARCMHNFNRRWSYDSRDCHRPCALCSCKRAHRWRSSTSRTVHWSRPSQPSPSIPQCTVIPSLTLLVVTQARKNAYKPNIQIPTFSRSSSDLGPAHVQDSASRSSSISPPHFPASVSRYKVSDLY